jgi:transposase-like protein
LIQANNQAVSIGRLNLYLKAVDQNAEYAFDPASLPVILDRVKAGSIVYADEASCWDTLHAKYLTKRINHSEAYSTPDACTNQAESFFSRLRRAEIGTHHHIAGPYLNAYADEMSWREDNRRRSTGELYLAMADAALKHPVSRQWKGYWQRAT